MVTTKLEAQKMLKRVGLDVEFKPTGHPDWVRGFIKRNGCKREASDKTIFSGIVHTD